MTARVILMVLILGCTACAPRQQGTKVETLQSATGTADPFEPVNRSVAKLNTGLTTVLIKPVLTLYRALVPAPLRRGVANVSANAKAPLIFAHDVLQGEGDRALTTLGRFLMNSTVGIGGLLDPAKHAGLAAHDEDAGQTFARWGMPSGPYLMLPLLGPSNLRDAAGLAADLFADPLRYVLKARTVPLGISGSPVGTFAPRLKHEDSFRGDIGLGLIVASIVTQMDANVDGLDELNRGSVDPYVALRESYRQFRQAEIDNQHRPVQDVQDDPLTDVLDAPQ